MKTVQIVMGAYFNNLEAEINKVIKQKPDYEVNVAAAYVDQRGTHYAVLELIKR